jgi:hypothetical protein
VIAYDVTVTRDSGLWTAVVTGLPPHTVGATDVEPFADLETEVRDLIAGLTETDPVDFYLSWQHIIDSRDITELINNLAGSEHALRDAAHRDAAPGVIRALSVRACPSRQSLTCSASGGSTSWLRPNGSRRRSAALGPWASGPGRRGAAAFSDLPRLPGHSGHHGEARSHDQGCHHGEVP